MTEPRKPRKASWRELPPAEMAAHLLASPTIADGVWTSEPRLPSETRSDFVRRVLLGETPEFQPETPEAEAAELAGLKRGYYLLNADGGNRGDRLGRAAIGALLRTRRLVTVAQISKVIGPATHNEAEYQALIEGLKLARDHGIRRIRVFMDSELVVDHALQKHPCPRAVVYFLNRNHHAAPDSSATDEARAALGVQPHHERRRLSRRGRLHRGGSLID
jgi:ribonuclease HI